MLSAALAIGDEVSRDNAGPEGTSLSPGVMRREIEESPVDTASPASSSSSSWRFTPRPMERPKGSKHETLQIDAFGLVDRSVDVGSEALAQRDREDPKEEEEEKKEDEKKSDYLKLDSGKCGDKDMFPIHSKDLCEKAAADLKLDDTEADETDTKDRPEGCFFKENKDKSDKQLWFSTSSKNDGNKAKGGRALLCGKEKSERPVSSKASGDDKTPETAPPIANAGFFGYLIGAPPILGLCGAFAFLLSVGGEAEKGEKKKKKKNKDDD